MKKKLAMLVASAMVIGTLAGCGNNNNLTLNPEEAEAETEASADASSEGDTAAEAEPVEMHMEEDAYVTGINLDDYVTLGDYNGIELEKEEIVIDDADVQAEVASYESYLGYREIDKEVVEEGDIINVDYEGKYADSGEAFDGGTAEGSDIDTSQGGFIDGFLEGMYGHKVGETFDMDCTFPEDYGNADLAGKDVVFTVTINAIQEPEELTDETVGQLTEILGLEEELKTIRDLEKHVTEELTATAESNAEMALEDQALAKVLESSTFKDAPEHMIARYTSLLNNSLEQNAYYYYLYYGEEKTADDLLTETREAEGFEGTNEEYLRHLAQEQCNTLMALHAIAKAEGIEIPEETIEASVKSALENNGVETAEAYAEQAGTNINEMVRESMIAQAALEFIMNNANVKEVKASAATSSSADEEEAADAADSADTGSEEETDEADEN